MIVSNFQRLICSFFCLSDILYFLFKLQLQNSMPVSLSQPHPAVNQKCTVSFFGQRSWCSHLLLLLLMIRLVILGCAGSGALNLIWKCKLVTRASAPLLRAAPHHEHIWLVLHCPCFGHWLGSKKGIWNGCWFTRAINVLRLASLERSFFPLSSDTMVKIADRSYHQGSFPRASL